MHTSMEFAEGQSMYIEHSFFKKDGQLRLLTKINGQCPASVLNANIASISIDKYKEVIVQMNPSLGLPILHRILLIMSLCIQGN